MTDEHRDTDLRALNGLLDSESLSDKERIAFENMLADITGATSFRQLSRKQREWALSVCDRFAIVVVDPHIRNKDVPRGREVETPAILLSLPKSPPKRRIA